LAQEKKSNELGAKPRNRIWRETKKKSHEFGAKPKKKSNQKRNRTELGAKRKKKSRSKPLKFNFQKKEMQISGAQKRNPKIGVKKEKRENARSFSKHGK